MKLVRLLSGLGYGTRRECIRLLRSGAVRDAQARTCGVHEEDSGGTYTVSGEPLDPRGPLIVVLHKPRGVETTRSGSGPTVFDLLPPRFRVRRPALQPVGRLVKDTTGLLLFTDDGGLLHRLTHPRHHVDKDYEFQTARPISPTAVEQFASGTLVLRSESTPLKPAQLRITGPCSGRLTLREGRYHQVRRMWAAIGNHVTQLHRDRVGPVGLGALASGAWRILPPEARAAVYASVDLSAPDIPPNR